MKNCIIELQELSDELYEQKNELQTLINQNLFQIEKINVYLKSLFEKEDSDFKVFSPRNVETIYGEQIELNNKQKENLESENINYYKKLNILNKQIEKMSQVIDSLKSSDSYNNTFEENIINKEPIIEISESIICEEKEQQDNNKKYMQHISHQIRNAISILNVDVQRAKIELTSIANKLDME